MTGQGNSAEDVAAPTGRSTVVLVTGAGRSGTSTVTGVLKYLGVQVPAPEIEANETNPRGFFETKWVVWRNQQILSRTRAGSLDADPGVARLTEAAARRGFEGKIRRWIAQTLDHARPTYVIKDPRTIWTAGTWTALLEEAGYDVKYLTMLRHPVEVLGSRKQHYRDGIGAGKAGTVETAQLAGWINVNLASERLGRGHDHVFVRYEDLLADWRGAMRQVRDLLGLELNHDLGDTPHEVDNFVEPTLRRQRGDWEDMNVPDWLRELAQESWVLLGARASQERSAAELVDRFDDVARRYEAEYEWAFTLVGDRVRRKVNKARKQGRVEERNRLEGLRAEAPAAVPGIEDATTRQIVDELGGRLRSRLLRRKV